MDAQSPLESLPLYGVDSYKVDEKHRISLPAKYRKMLPENLVVRLSSDKKFPSLIISSIEYFKEYREQMFEADGGFRQSNLEHQRRQHDIDRNIAYLELDSANRLKIPLTQFQKARIGKDVVIMGDELSLSVWDVEVFAAYEDYLDSRGDSGQTEIA
ncbi:MAG: hypothetical protein LBS98_00350 [Coriobacteriales bacterium]|jgi:MraZ protein|nr:hypothetical protein [Coriobacteriales bacterium]